MAQAKAIAFAKWTVWVKNYKCQKDGEKGSTRALELFLAKKTLQKPPKYSRNETILKIGHFPKAITHARPIAFAEWTVWVKN